MENTTQTGMATAIKKFPTGKLVIAGIVLILLGWVGGVYNGLITSREAINQNFAQLQNQYQRRSDLIPNLVSTVQGYAKFEKTTLTDVVNARASATKITVDASTLTQENLKKLDDSQMALSGALGRLLAVSENYPNLKADQRFAELSAELAGTENRIAVARKDYNTVVQEYNLNVQRFPGSMLARIFGFSVKPYFEAQPGAETVPTVNFQ